VSPELDRSEARALIEARLGRPPDDAYEAAVVLEAWGGEHAGTVFRTGSDVVRDVHPRGRLEGKQVADSTAERTLADGIATLLAVLGVAAWSTPLANALGSDESIAFGLALPLALAAQWAVRSRYRIVGRRRLVGLRRDLPGVAVATAAGTPGAWLLLGRAGLVAALLVVIWAGGAVVARAGWGWLHAGVIGAVALALNLGAPALGVLGTAAVAISAVVAVAALREDPDADPGPAALACAGAATGLLLGLLLTADSTIAWGMAWVLGVALVPSVLAALWAGAHLATLHVRLVAELSQVEPRRAGAQLTALRILGGAGVRYLGCCLALSFAVGLLVTSTEPTVRVLLLAFGIVGVLSTVAAFLEALGWRVAAVGSMAAAAVIAITLGHAGQVAAGEPVIVGGAVGAVIALSCAVAALSRPAQLLATRLWIL
jgi:hypothetical protein